MSKVYVVVEANPDGRPAEHGPPTAAFRGCRKALGLADESGLAFDTLDDARAWIKAEAEDIHPSEVYRMDEESAWAIFEVEASAKVRHIESTGRILRVETKQFDAPVDFTQDIG